VGLGNGKRGAAPTSPSATVAPVASGTAEAGQTLSVTNGTWTNTPTGYTYQWLADGAPISGATAATYLLTSAEIGKSVRCAVTAANASGANTANSNLLGPVVAAGLVAPTLTRTSANGAAPLTWDTATNDLYEGLTIRVETSADGIKDGSGNYVTPTQSISKAITNVDLASGNFVLTATNGASGDFVTPSGLYYLHSRIEQDNGTTSAWSNELTDTISSATAAFYASNGVNKNPSAIVSNYNGTLRSVTANNAQNSAVRVTADAAGDYYQIEFVINSLSTGNFVQVGFDDGTTDFSNPNGSTMPGKNNALGVRLMFGPFGIDPVWNSNASASYPASQPTLAVNDIITVRGRKSTGFVETWYTRSGTTTFIHSFTVPQANALKRFWAAGFDADQITFNSGQEAFAMALSGGAVAYG